MNTTRVELHMLHTAVESSPALFGVLSESVFRKKIDEEVVVPKDNLRVTSFHLLFMSLNSM